MKGLAMSEVKPAAHRNIENEGSQAVFALCAFQRWNNHRLPGLVLPFCVRAFGLGCIS